MNDFNMTFNDRDDFKIWDEMMKRKKLKKLKEDRIEKLKQLSNPISIQVWYNDWINIFNKEKLKKDRIEKLNNLNNDN